MRVAVATANRFSGPKTLAEHGADGDLLRRAIDACPGVEDRDVAEAWGVSHAAVSHVIAGRKPLGVSKIKRLPREVGVAVARILGDHFGMDVVERPAAGVVADDYVALAEIAKEAGDVLTRIGSSLADGVWSRGEGAETVAEIDQAIAALHRYRARAVGIAKDGAQGTRKAAR